MDLNGKSWRHICQFAREQFGTQRSRVVAKYAAMMDPVAMAMSACLCARLRRISKDPRRGIGEADHSRLPSILELERSIIELFAEQDPSGIWPKYFPLFHYQDAGSNFCFTFELLEAVLVEFGGRSNALLSNETVISGLQKAIGWCESNRLRYFDERANGDVTRYEGWNSGGNLETLRRGQPESWATAVVHMFLWELVDVLSKRIQQRLLDLYAARTPDPKWKPVAKLLDIDLLLDGKPIGLKKTLLTTIVGTFVPFKGDGAEQLRRKPIKKNAPRSALLFGPPGTSKTEVAKSFSKELDWPLVEIDPSHFLQHGFSKIYVEAERIFEDVMDMTGVVILFDEMDALVQKRDADTYLDTEGNFRRLHAPELAKLHDRGQVVFLMATNFQASFDDAVKRAGRFDFLLCMGLPRLKPSAAHSIAFSRN